MRTAEEIVKALRCSITEHLEGEEPDCKNCPYFYRAEPSEDIKQQVGDVSDGFWDMCDCDRIFMDAVELIERLIYDKSTV